MRPDIQSERINASLWKHRGEAQWFGSVAACLVPRRRADFELDPHMRRVGAP